jgi:hypothetical protein
LRDLEEVSNYAANLRQIELGRVVYGRACIRAKWYWQAAGRITVGGFAATELEYLEGILLGTTDVLARNAASLSAPPEALARWAEEQAEIISRSEIPNDEQLIAAGVVIACGGDPGRLPIARLGGRYLNRRHLGAAVRTMSAITLFHGEPSFDEDSDDCHPREFKSSFVHAPDVMFLGEVPGTRYNKKSWWPGEPSYWSVLKSILDRRWRRYVVRTEEEKEVGRVADVKILRDVEVITPEA